MKHKTKAHVTPIRLNVIFHGPFFFVIYPKRVEAFAADIEEHVFGVGGWQREQRCKAKTYKLKGSFATQTNLQGPDPGDHIILDPMNLPKMKLPKKGYYHFRLPKPNKILALGRLTFTGKLKLGGANAGVVKCPPRIGSAHLFSYDLASADHITMKPLDWKAAADDKGIINLHIFAESPFLENVQHPCRDFRRLVALAPGLSLKAPRTFPKVDFHTNPAAAAFGVRNQEQGGLRGLPPQKPHDLVPPQICDSPSLFIVAG